MGQLCPTLLVVILLGMSRAEDLDDGLPKRHCLFYYSKRRTQPLSSAADIACALYFALCTLRSAIFTLLFTAGMCCWGSAQCKLHFTLCTLH